jgi:acyl carrier protein
MTSIEQADIARRIRRVFVQALSLNLNPDDPSMSGPDPGSVAGLDSLAMLGFVAGLEEEFHVQIEPDRLTIEFLGDLEAMTTYFAERLHATPQD